MNAIKSSTYSTYEVRERAVKAVLLGQRKVDVAKAYQIDYTTLFRWYQRYKKTKNFQSLVRQSGSGRPNLLDIQARKNFVKIITQPASDFGYETDFWTCRRLIQITEKKLNVKVSKPTMWRILRDMGLTYQKPERRYFEANDKIRKKWVRYEVPKIKRIVKKLRAILYFQDESNISLTTVLGKTWAPKGKTPIQCVTGNRGGFATMSAISQVGKLVFRLHQKRITSIEVIDFLRQLLKHHKYRNVVVVMDQARVHTSKKTQLFIKEQKRLHVFYLPPRSPDFNPDEQVWNHLKHQKLKNNSSRTKEDLKNLTTRKLREMSRKPELLNGIFFRSYMVSLLN